LAFSSPDAAAQGYTLAAAAAAAAPAAAAAAAVEDDVGGDAVLQLPRCRRVGTTRARVAGSAAVCFLGVFCVVGLTALEPHSGSLLQGSCGTSHKDQLAFNLGGLWPSKVI
jgi:hypothetical protein